MRDRIIIIGANGQIGTELAIALREKNGSENILTTDLRQIKELEPGEKFLPLDVLDKDRLREVFGEFKPTQVYLLAAMLSAVGEQYPQKSWELNMDGLLNVLNLCVDLGINKVFWPSSIAVFGPHSPKSDTPQYCVMDPNTMYGISKLAGERLCEYYYNRYNLDIRSVRYPGVISWKTQPGGGTTDYAVHIYFEALKEGKYACFLSEDTRLPMVYMEDVIKGTIQLMDAPSECIRIRSSYNLSSMSFTPADISKEIKKIIPDFQISYLDSDPRQAIAETWPKSIEDNWAREDWGWSPEFDLRKMTEDMIENLKDKV